MRQLDDKDRELAAMEETLQLLAPEGPDGERLIRPDLSRSDTKRLESLQSWMSLGHTRSAERIKHAPLPGPQLMSACLCLPLPKPVLTRARALFAVLGPCSLHSNRVGLRVST